MFHILVVDDDKNTRQLIKAVLETENYIVGGNRYVSITFNKGKF